MNASELLLTAKKIAESHISSGMDLNDAITKTASEHNLSKDQIERLVEETNKVTFLELLEKKGEQEFPVADYNVVKSKLTPKIEKTASEKLKFESLVYSETEFRKQIGESKINTTIEKTANDKSLSPECLVYIEAFTKVAQEVWNDYQTYTDLMSLGQKRYGNRYNESTSLEKIAKEHRDTDVSNIKELEKKIIKQGAVLEVIDGQLEKLAHGIWKNTIVSKTNNPVERAATYSGKGLEKLAVLNLVGKGVSAVINPVLKAPLYVAGGVARVGLKGAAMGGAVALPVVAGVAMRHPGASLNVGFEGAKGVGITKQKLGEKRYVGPGTFTGEKESSVKLFQEPLDKNAGAMDAIGNVVKPVLNVGGKLLGGIGHIGTIMKNAVPGYGPGMAKIGTVEKDASISEGLQHGLDFVLPAAMMGVKGPFGMFMGITAAAAKKLGGGIALTMNKKEFDRSFDTIMQNNPELAENKQQVRGYFDVVSRHAPTLAKDPLVAESIVKNMNAFGGVDYNTIRGLRETEALGKEQNTSGLAGVLPFSFNRK